MSDLQRIVDALGRSSGRAVAVTDTKGRILAYSAHAKPVDEVRTTSILTRQTPAESFAWSRSQGIESATGPVRVAPRAEVGMLGRVCAPVRYEQRLLGFLWLVDDDASFPDSQFELLRSAAEAAALAVHREQLLEALDRGHERELLRDLLSGVAAERERAADDLVGRDLFVARPVAALVLRPVRGRTAMTREDAEARSCVSRALDQVRSTMGRRQALDLVRHDHGLLVLAVDGRRRGADPVAATGAALHAAATTALAGLPGWRAVVGTAEPQPGLAELPTAYQQALRAAEAASLLESFGPVTAWAQLGVYQTLLSLPLAELTRSSLHPGLVALLALRDGPVWLQTLECWFDLGCDARAAAEALNVQRGTLYHRLHRIEELAAVDLGRGDDRLALHLGLKLIHLAGLE